MRLWTIQPIDVFNQVMSVDGYRVNVNHPDYCGNSDEEFKKAYAWLHNRAVKRGLKDNGHGLIWSWYLFDIAYGHRKPDVRTIRKMYGHPGEEMCCMTLEVPEGKVLLIDSDKWSSCICGNPCLTEEQIEMSDEEYKKWFDELYALPEVERHRYNETTWDLVFDTREAGAIEAIFFGLDRSMIKAVQFFTRK